MNQKSSQSSDFFSTNLIDLSFKADRESKAFTSRLLWENLALKVVTKLKLLVDLGFNYAIKRRIESKLRNQQALSPNDLLMYRSKYWEATGARNYNKIIQAINQSNHSNGSQNEDLKTESFSRLFLEKLFKLRRQGKLKLIESTYFQGENAKAKIFYLFFDSYHFFNGGHLANIEQTIDNLQSINCNPVFIFLLDRNMILFPQLSSLILKKCSNRIIFDSTDYPIKFNSISQAHEAISQLAANHSIKLDHSILTEDCSVNPCISWKNYPYGVKNNPQKVWTTTFRKDDSIKIINNTFKTLLLSTISKPYAVIHTRNSALMPDNVRNSKPLKERAELFESILNMGLQVIVLGVMDPSSKFKHPEVIYADELGPISDDLQIHILNGALAVIGSPSGVTHLTYCTDTPTLLLDMPFPFCTCYPNSNIKALLKQLRHNGENVSLAKYYKLNSQSALENEELRDAEGRPFSPLKKEGIELQCNSDAAILHAFQELLINTYEPWQLNSLNIELDHERIDAEAMNYDRREISLALKTCRKDSDKYPYFEIRDLSAANWLREHPKNQDCN